MGQGSSRYLKNSANNIKTTSWPDTTVGIFLFAICVNQHFKSRIILGFKVKELLHFALSKGKAIHAYISSHSQLTVSYQLMTITASTCILFLAVGRPCWLIFMCIHSAGLKSATNQKLVKLILARHYSICAVNRLQCQFSQTLSAKK